MIDVEHYFRGDVYETEVLVASVGFLKKLDKFAKRKGQIAARFLLLIERAARNGFDQVPHVVVPEWDGVYSIGDRYGSLARAAGFFVQGVEEQTFVIMEFYEKHGQGLRPNERAIINSLAKVAKVLPNEDWRLID